MESVVAFQYTTLVQWVGALLKFCRDVFLNQISELFVRFNPKFWEPAHVSFEQVGNCCTAKLFIASMVSRVLTESAWPTVFFLRADPLFLKFETLTRLNYADEQGLSLEIKVQSGSSLRGHDPFCFEVCLNTISLMHPNPIYLALKLTTSVKRQLYSINLNQQFYQTCQNIFFEGIQWYH